MNQKFASDYDNLRIDQNNLLITTKTIFLVIFSRHRRFERDGERCSSKIERIRCLVVLGDRCLTSI